MAKRDEIKQYLGIGLITMGLILLLEESQLLGFSLLRMASLFWPLVLVFWGGLELAENKPKLGLALIMLGAVIQTSKLTRWSFWSLFWSVLLIGAGVVLLNKAWSKRCLSVLDEEPKMEEVVADEAEKKKE